jgi:hypothetical protein
MRYQIGWYFVAVAVLNIIINWFVIVCKVVKAVVTIIENKIKARRMKK